MKCPCLLVVSFDCFQSSCYVLCDVARFPSLLKDAGLCPLQLTPLTLTSHLPLVISKTRSFRAQHSCISPAPSGIYQSAPLCKQGYEAGEEPGCFCPDFSVGRLSLMLPVPRAWCSLHSLGKRLSGLRKSCRKPWGNMGPAPQFLSKCIMGVR